MLLEELPGFAVLKISGQRAWELFQHEAGGHRWQRVPPTEKRGRVHTSTVTVAVLPIPSEVTVPIQEKDLEIKVCRGSGAGGQHRNVTDSAVQITHRPSKISVRCENERSQHQNKMLAMEILRTRLQQAASSRAEEEYAKNRRQQIGSGQRGDKVRTIAVQRDQVIHHSTDRRVSVGEYLRGFLEKLWE